MSHVRSRSQHTTLTPLLLPNIDPADVLCSVDLLNARPPTRVAAHTRPNTPLPLPLNCTLEITVIYNLELPLIRIHRNPSESAKPPHPFKANGGSRGRADCGVRIETHQPTRAPPALNVVKARARPYLLQPIRPFSAVVHHICTSVYFLIQFFLYGKFRPFRALDLF